jgi:hypothetical protein
MDGHSMRAQMARSRSLFLRAMRCTQIKRWMGLLASSYFLVIFMTLCAPPPFTQASADMLDVNIQVVHQYALDTPEVGISMTFAKQGDAGASPGAPLSMACNGVTFPHLRGNILLQITVPRQPAGGAYNCVYTDDKGTKTPFIIPIPAGTLAITSPKAHDTVPIPKSASSSPDATPTPGTIPFSASSTLTVHYTAPTVPSGASVTIGAVVESGNVSISGTANTVTDTIDISDAGLTSDHGFQALTPGMPGEIRLRLDFSWSPSTETFHKIKILYTDIMIIPITWGES